MRITFYCSDKPREIMLAQALVAGAKLLGDSVEMRRTADYGEDEEGNERRYSGPTPDTDVACIFGAKGQSKRILNDHWLLKKATLYFDKGFTRTKGEGGHTEYSRVCVNAVEPSAYMMRDKHAPEDRWRKLGIKLEPRRSSPGGHVLFCGSSQKYHDFRGLGPADDFASGAMRSIRKNTLRQIVYRPKPSDKRAKPIGGYGLSPANQKIEDALRGCHLLVTHGATAAMDAIVAGVPAMALGPCVVSPVAPADMSRIEDPFWPKDNERFRWACAMAYTQWTTEELRNGQAWTALKAEIERQAK